MGGHAAVCVHHTMSKRKGRRPHHTPLSKHQKVGTKLVSPMGALNFTSVEWSRDLLPEHLWIGAVAVAFGLDRFHNQYGALVDALDGYVAGDEINLGLLSDFGRVPEERRVDFLTKHRDLVRLTVVDVIGGWLRLYPDSPAAWVLSGGAPCEKNGSNPMAELAVLRRLIVRLLPGKDAFAGRVRAVPLERTFRHDKLKIPRGLPVAELFNKYPAYCSEDERQQVESFARTTLNLMIGMREDLRGLGWPKYFWRHNYDLAVCSPAGLEVDGGDDIGDDFAKTIIEALDKNGSQARSYLAHLSTKLRIDLYDPLADEILFGLLGRVTRLYCLLLETPQLWARDTSGIVLRCLAETAISFAYLVKHGSKDEFEKFREHGEGQEKLLMLHLQDNHPSSKTLDGLTSEQIAEQLGDFPTELLNIELGHWSKKDTRRLAQEAGVDDLYRLVFTPASGDVHGTWVSLKRSNLVSCAEVLHRFHRLPSFVEPPFFVQVVEVARELYERCVLVASGARSYPPNAAPLVRLTPPVRKTGER